MCGISGIVSHDVAPATVRGMVDLQRHRGPDQHDIWISPGGHCVIGSNRLSIIDRSPASDQPQFDPARGIALVYNGEVYNYRELRQQLKSTWRFTSDGDTEVVLAAYVHWGPSCVEHFNGMYAFAIWSEQERSLFLARDRLGEKPLYYMHQGGTFAFASEISPLARLGASLDIEPKEFTNYLTADTTSTFETGTSTLFEGIKRLRPAQTMTVRYTAEGRAVAHQSHTYWSIEQSRTVRNMASASRQIADLLDDSVKLRLRSDVPVGTCLSGGLDSSSIVSSIRAHQPDGDLHTFTGAFPEHEAADETKYALRVAEEFGCTAHVIPITPQSFLEDAPTFYAAAGLPVGGLSQYAQWRVFGLAAEHDVTVLLDGQGSDEIFAGYGGAITQAHLSSLLWSGKLPTFVEERRAAHSAYEISSLQALKLDVAKWLRRPLIIRSLRPFLSSEGMQLIKKHGPGLADAKADSGRNAFDTVLRRLTQRTMLPSLLRYGDHLSMHFSREVRLPFCDHRIVEAAFSLDQTLLVGGGASKAVLREAMKHRLPSDIVHRPKQGFVPPEAEWFGGPLNSWMTGVVDNISPDLARYLDTKAVQRGIERLRTTSGESLGLLWRIVNVCAWELYARQELIGSHLLP